ncbi:DUF4240 domain-containing protein [Streptomyces sp. NPDC006393]|uniref:DUF4240 domain-containing protein n=1 Tax=Streptomyces sp. NPDC006393 TaxID=3156763 RepID=UPI0033D0E552
MDEDAFWALIEEFRPAWPDPDADALAAALTARLAAGPVSLITEFAEQLAWALYRLDLQEYGRCLSGDAFLYARAAVVADGGEAHWRVLQDPARFTPYAEGLLWAESLLYVPDRAYKALTGQEWDRGTRFSYESYSNRAGWGRQAMTDDELVEAVRTRVADRDLPSPATPDDVAAVERAVGRPMPPLLRRLYLEVANGGFGVWECLSLTDTGNRFSDERDMIEAHRLFSMKDDSGIPAIPEGVVPLMDRGCSMWTMIDFSTPEGRVWDWDANDCCRLVPTTLTLARWLTGWLEGWIVPGPYSPFRIHPDDCPDRQPSVSSQ